VVSLDSLGITSISTNATAEPTKDNGNLIGLTSTFEMNGTTQTAADVWFVADKAAALAGTAQPATAVATVVPEASPQVATVAAPIALDWNVALAPAATETASAASPAPVPQVAGTVDLRTQVSGIAQAISAFSGDAVSGTADTPKLNVATSSSGGVALTAVSMADVLKQFDANGNMLVAQGTSATALNGVPSLTATQDPNAAGALASATPKPTGG